MRDLDHYLNLYRSSDTVGSKLVALGIYAARHGDSDDYGQREVADLVRSLPESMSADSAAACIASDLLGIASEEEVPGETIRRAREALGWSRERMGERMGLPVHGRQCSTLRSWELGKRSPDWESRKKIKALATSLREGIT